MIEEMINIICDPLELYNWLEIEPGPWREQTVRYVHSPTELS